MSTSTINPRDRLIFALDVPDATAARQLVEQLGDAVTFYKVGLELMAAGGYFELVEWLLKRNKKVFADLKFFDVPATVSRAVSLLAKRGITFATVHGNQGIMEAAAAAKGELKILAVTVLTSFDDQDLADLGVSGRTSAEQVEFLAGKGRAAGVDGFVCSPLEVARLREISGPERLLVVPGVRSAEADKGDQKRVATPAEAMNSGATYLVIGREITRSADPAGTARRILDDLQRVYRTS